MSESRKAISPLNSHELDERDPDYREDYAVLELLRSLSIGKMVAVIGSGVPTIYGYMDWDTFIKSVIDDFGRWASMEGMLDERGIAIFRAAYANYESRIKNDGNTSSENIAILGELCDSLTEKGKKAYHERIKLYFSPRESLKFTEVPDRYRNAIGMTGEHTRKNHPLLPDISGLLDLMPGVSRSASRPRHAETLSSSRVKIENPRNIIDPLIRIRKELDISRFVTFNYDIEIEKLLEDLDYPFDSLSGPGDTDKAVRTAQSRIGAIGKSISLTEKNASELIALAAIPTSANDVIVHIHGSIHDTAGMVVTQRDYNQRYFDSYPGRDTFEDAQSLLFGGNSVIYVGVGLTEEDVMRPLRYLGSNDRKRPIFALLPVLSTEEKARSMAMRVWANYGINVILYGRNWKTIPSAWKELSGLQHPRGNDFISLGEELRYLEATKSQSGSAWISKIKALLKDEAKSPRLSRQRDAGARNYISSLIFQLNGKKDAKFFSAEKVAKLVDYLKLLTISTALDDVMTYMRRGASAWQQKMNGENDKLADIPANYGCSQIPEKIEGVIDHHDREEIKQFDKAFKSIEAGSVTIMHLARGKGKGTFAVLLRARCQKDKINARFISLDRTMRVRTVLTDVIDQIDKYELICIQNADFLLDGSTKMAKTVSMQKFI